MTESGWKVLTWEHSAEYTALRDKTVKYLQEIIPDLIDEDFNLHDGIGWTEDGYSQSINAPSLALNPPSREMPGLMVGTHFILVQVTKILPEQIREVTSLVAEFGYASIWVLADVADTPDNRAAAIVCRGQEFIRHDQALIPSLLTGEKDNFGHWSVASVESGSLLEAATQTAERRRSHWEKINYFAQLMNAITTLPSLDPVKNWQQTMDLADRLRVRSQKVRSRIIAESPIDRADWTSADVLLHLIDSGVLKKEVNEKISAARIQMDSNRQREN